MAATFSRMLVLDSVWLKSNLFITKFIYMIHKFQSLSHRKHTQPPVNANGEVNISHENTTMVVWIYDGINSKK